MSCPPIILADEMTMAGSSTVVLLVLFLLFAMAVGMFWWLIARESSNRRLILLREWARNSDFRISPRSQQSPPLPLQALRGTPRVIECLVGAQCTLVRFGTLLSAAESPPEAGSPPETPRQWHVLIWGIQSDWPAAALRPANATRSLTDLLSLPPQLGEGTQRFTVCTVERATARALGRSSARGLLPPDIGMLLIGRHLLLDFSDRPFDGVEFNRMIAVAEQVAAQLPRI